MRMIFVTLFCWLACLLDAVEINRLDKALRVRPPFHYDMHVTVLPASVPDAPVLICCHGYGHDYSVIKILKQIPQIREHLVGFNFPDFNVPKRRFKEEDLTIGTINELLPLCYVLKQCVIGAGAESVNMYGFSAGGGAVVNAIAVLNSNQYDDNLKNIGISKEEKKTILAAIQKGYILLDAPLKSIEELPGYERGDPDTRTRADRFLANNLRPIDSIDKLKGLKLNVLIHFQDPDEALGNRDDTLYIEKFETTNAQGNTYAIIGHDGGHTAYHSSLWQAYPGFLKKIYPTKKLTNSQ